MSNVAFKRSAGKSHILVTWLRCSFCEKHHLMFSKGND